MKTKILNYINDVKPNYLNRNTIVDFKNYLSHSYNHKSNKQLHYAIFNLLSMKKDNKSATDISSYSKYLKFKDIKKGITADNMSISDAKSHFLLEKDVRQATKAYLKAKYLEYINRTRLKLFITFTCPTTHNYYTKQGTRRNYKCKFKNLDECIQESLKLQREVNNYFYRQLNKYLQRNNQNTTDFVRSLEPSKGLVIHSHSIYFIDNKESIKIAKHIFKQVKEKFGLKMVDIKVLKDEPVKEDIEIEGYDSVELNQNSQATNYVIKYITKTLFVENNQNEDEKKETTAPFYTEYKRYYSKYRFFSSSKFKNCSQIQLDKVYIFLSKNYPDKLDKFKNDKKIPLYVHLENYINNKVVFETKIKQYTQTNYKKIYRRIDTLKQSNWTTNSIVKDIKKNLTHYQNKVQRKSIDFAYDKDTWEVIYINNYKMGEVLDEEDIVYLINGESNA